MIKLFVCLLLVAEIPLIQSLISSSHKLTTASNSQVCLQDFCLNIRRDQFRLYRDSTAEREKSALLCSSSVRGTTVLCSSSVREITQGVDVEEYLNYTKRGSKDMTQFSTIGLLSILIMRVIWYASPTFIGTFVNAFGKKLRAVKKSRVFNFLKATTDNANILKETSVPRKNILYEISSPRKNFYSYNDNDDTFYFDANGDIKKKKEDF